jgi:hypothetical protein
MSHPQCCEFWPKIRPHLSWFRTCSEEEADNEEVTDLLVAPTIGPTRPGAVRVQYCPSCGAPTRQFTWSLKEMRQVEP